MNDQTLFEMVRQADPVEAVAGVEEPPREVLERVLASARDERRPARRLRARRRLVLAAAVLGLGAVIAGLAIAGTGWLTGEPAPPAVVTDFQAYTPQLGFYPDPGSAVLVAEDGQIKLYATTNREGTYCLVLDEPWKPATTLDGGTCVSEAIASGHFVAGLVGGGPLLEQHTTLVVGGRIADTKARSVRFTGPNGRVIERPVGRSGFFVASVSIEGLPCVNGDWSSTFTALDAGGNTLAQTRTISLTKTTHTNAQGQVRACLLSFLQK